MPLVGCTSVGDAHTYRVACGGPIAADADAVVKQVQVLYRKGQRAGRHKGRISREVVCPDCQWPQGYREFVDRRTAEGRVLWLCTEDMHAPDRRVRATDRLRCWPPNTRSGSRTWSGS